MGCAKMVYGPTVLTTTVLTILVLAAASFLDSALDQRDEDVEDMRSRTGRGAAVRRINQATAPCINTALAFGDPIPEPKCERLMLN